MIDHIEALIKEVEAFSAKEKKDIEAFRIKFLGKKGVLTELFADFKSVPNDQKKTYGLAINSQKLQAQKKSRGSQK